MSRKEIIATAHKLAARGWVANHDGNVSMRLRGDRFLCTPTATAKADVSDKNLPARYLTTLGEVEKVLTVGKEPRLAVRALPSILLFRERSDLYRLAASGGDALEFRTRSG